MCAKLWTLGPVWGQKVVPVQLAWLDRGAVVLIPPLQLLHFALLKATHILLAIKIPDLWERTSAPYPKKQSRSGYWNYWTETATKPCRRHSTGESAKKASSTQGAPSWGEWCPPRRPGPAAPACQGRCETEGTLQGKDLDFDVRQRPQEEGWGPQRILGNHQRDLGCVFLRSILFGTLLHLTWYIIFTHEEMLIFRVHGLLYGSKYDFGV